LLRGEGWHGRMIATGLERSTPEHGFGVHLFRTYM
jgi:hypothetical protein